MAEPEQERVRHGATELPPEPTRAEVARVSVRWFVDHYGFEGGAWWPSGCDDCPFQAPTREPREEIWNDYSEAHYLCPLLRKEVWGEDPECREKLFDSVKDILREALEGMPT